MSLRPPPGWDAPPLPPRDPAILANDGGPPVFPEPGALPPQPSPPSAFAAHAFVPQASVLQPVAPEPIAPDAAPHFGGFEGDASGDRATPVMGTFGGPDPYGNAHPTPLVPPAAEPLHAAPPLADPVHVTPPFADPLQAAPPFAGTQVVPPSPTVPGDAGGFILGQDPLAGVVTPTEQAVAANAPAKPKVRLGLIIGVTIFALAVAALAGFFVLRSAGSPASTEAPEASGAKSKSKRKKTAPTASATAHAVGTFQPRRPRALPSHAAPSPSHDSVPLEPTDDDGELPAPPATPTDQPRPYPH